MSNTVTLSQQKLDMDEIRMGLQRFRSEIDHKIKVLSRGMEEIDNGENMMESNSILAQEVRKIYEQSNLNQSTT